MPSSDTSAEAYQVQLDLIRKMTPQQRLRKAMGLSQQVKKMGMDAIRRRHPDFDEEAVKIKFIELTYGKELADDVARWKKERGLG